MTDPNAKSPERRAYYRNEARRTREAVRQLIALHRGDYLRIQRELKEAEDEQRN